MSTTNMMKHHVLRPVGYYYFMTTKDVLWVRSEYLFLISALGEMIEEIRLFLIINECGVCNAQR